MKFCTDCCNFDRCNAIGRVVDFSVDDGVCRDFDECKPQTNADRIRAMSDEELDYFLHKVTYGLDECPHEYGSEKALEWLQRPSEGNDHDTI